MPEIRSGVPPTAPPPPPGPSRPADYYSQTPGTQASQSSGCAKWAIGCGGGGCLVLLLLLAGGAWLVSHEMPTLVGYVFKNVEKAAMQEGPSAATPEQRSELHDQVIRLRENLQKGAISTGEIQSLVEEAAQAASDGKVTDKEIDSLLARLKDVNDQAEHAPPEK